MPSHAIEKSKASGTMMSMNSSAAAANREELQDQRDANMPMAEKIIELVVVGLCMSAQVLLMLKNPQANSFRR
ncbi:unnamed protein product [Linum trigynum]|uniref:Uncharacterized protein n=1 Tax=Linum trigynum TaxID=586398 RepID=A0AAV2FMJ3_9ROSI